MFIKFISYISLFLLNFAMFTDAYELGKEHDQTIIYTTSITSLARLKEIEDLYVEQFQIYTELLQHKLHVLKLYLQKLKHEKQDNQQQRVQYVSNPLRAFALVKRLHQDWPKWQNYTKKQVGEAQLEAMDMLLTKAPTAEDMREAHKGMYRIEHMYELESADIAKGLLWGKQYDVQLSTTECLSLADYMYSRNEYLRAAKWYRNALHYHTEHTDPIFQQIYGSEREEIRKKYIISRLKAGNANDVKLYLAELSHEPQRPLANSALPTSTSTQLGCQGLYVPKTNLICRYNFKTTPFLRLAPLKMEVLNWQPQIVLYYNMLFEHEIIAAKNESMEMYDGWTGLTDYADPKLELERICKVSLVHGNHIGTIGARIRMMTGLNISDDIELQINNYGLGGHFRNHFDYVDLKGSSEHVPYFQQFGNSLASVVFYTSDVELGGATVFPRLNLTIWPQKGAAIVWYNLDNVGTPDQLTEHTVCPIVVGSRWSMSSFISENDQRFARPCYHN